MIRNLKDSFGSSSLTLSTSLYVSFADKIFEKNFFLRFLWKVTYNLIFIWRIQKSNSFSHILSYSSLFLPRLVKNVLKVGQSFLFTDLHQNYHNMILIWRIQKLNSFFHIFLFSSSFLPRLVKSDLKNESKLYFSDFHENFRIT